MKMENIILILFASCFIFYQQPFLFFSFSTLYSFFFFVFGPLPYYFPDSTFREFSPLDAESLP